MASLKELHQIPSYVKLIGNDAYPDAYISRISPDSETNLEYVLYTLKKYETAPPDTNMWFMRGTGVASNEGNPPDYKRAGWLKDMLLNDFDFIEVDEI